MKPLSIVIRQNAVVPFDRWLADELTRALGRSVPRSLTRKAIVTGFVTVGGDIARVPERMLRKGPSVFIRNFDWLPDEEIAAGLRILFEDSWLIAVDKPAGLPTHETADAGRPSLTQLVEQHLGKRPFVHHRLDAGTSGIVLFAKAAEANAGLALAFAGRDVKKTYTAVVTRPPIDWPSDMTIDTPLRVAKNGAVRTDSAGTEAVTKIRVLERRVKSLLVHAQPITGRKHQIRVHLASNGAPILGDTLYGGKATVIGRLMLHAEKLELTHPITGSRLIVQSPRPSTFAPPPERQSGLDAVSPTSALRRPAAGRAPVRAASRPSRGDASKTKTGKSHRTKR